MTHPKPTPEHDFGTVVVLRCLQIVGWHAKRAEGDMSAWPNDTLPVFYAKKFLKDAEVLGVDTVALWAAFEEGLQKGKPR